MIEYLKMLCLIVAVIVCSIIVCSMVSDIDSFKGKVIGLIIGLWLACELIIVIIREIKLDESEEDC